MERPRAEGARRRPSRLVGARGRRARNVGSRRDRDDAAVWSVGEHSQRAVAGGLPTPMDGIDDRSCYFRKRRVRSVTSETLVADVFISYVGEDRHIAERIARGLEGAGLSVWWDRHIHGGVDFAAEIERQLDAAKIVVVLWSASSLDSKWVRDEAQHARDENKLIPVRLDRVQPPLGFRQAQVLDFTGWDGDPNGTTFTDLVDSARHFIGGSTDAPHSVAPFVAPQRKRWGARPGLIAAGLAGVLAVFVAVFMRVSRAPPQPSVDLDGRIEIGRFEPLTKDEGAAGFAKGFTSAFARTFAKDFVSSVASDAVAAATPTDSSCAARSTGKTRHMSSARMSCIVRMARFCGRRRGARTPTSRARSRSRLPYSSRTSSGARWTFASMQMASSRRTSFRCSFNTVQRLGITSWMR